MQENIPILTKYSLKSEVKDHDIFITYFKKKNEKSANDKVEKMLIRRFG